MDEVAEYYDTHDISDEIAEAELERHEPRAAGAIMIGMSVRLPKPTMDRGRAAAVDLGVTPAVLMRTWIEERLT